jgi:hypothetical protein
VDAEDNGRQRRRGLDASRPLGSFIEVARSVLIEPAQFFAGLRESREEERSAGAPLLFALVCTAIGLFLTFLAAPLDPLLPQDTPNPLFDAFSRVQGDTSSVMPSVAFSIGLGTISTVLFIYLFAAIQHLIVLVFVREGEGFWATFLVVTYQSAVSMVNWIPVLGNLAALYGVYIAAVGLREMHGMTTTRALLAVLIPYLLPLAWSVYNLRPPL